MLKFSAGCLLNILCVREMKRFIVLYRSYSRGLPILRTVEIVLMITCLNVDGRW